jgi:hypothetical protein
MKPFLINCFGAFLGDKKRCWFNILSIQVMISCIVNRTKSRSS